MRLGLLSLGPLLLFLQGLAAVSVVDHHQDEEYEPEHEVSYEDALATALGTKVYPGSRPGCKPCTADEITYCRNGSVLKDHCCCDHGNEVFGFVQHTCRMEPCNIQAGDCAEYTRLRECCCHKYLASLWRYMAGGAETLRIPRYMLGITVLVILAGAVR